MADINDLSFSLRMFLKGYPFHRFAVADNPCAKMKKPLDKAKFALVTSAGLMRPADERFSNLIKLGDTSFREIPNDFAVRDLIEDHDSTSFDHAGIEQDKNLAFPLDRFKNLEKEDKIGELNHRHFSFMGSIVSPRSLIKETAPAVAKLLKEDQVDAVFLTPV